MFFDKGKFFYIELNIRLFIYLLFKRVDVITANDLDTLSACFFASKIKGVKLVYDSHEYFTELPELAHRPFEKGIWVMVERFIFPKLRWVSTVGHCIAKEYERIYGVPVKVVRNMPVSAGISESELPKERVLIYQGAINVGRGIELMMEAMRFLPEYMLWIVGDGTTLEKIRAQALGYKNVKVWGKVPFEELRPITKQALLGLSLEEDLGLNYRFALPNKLFDYVHAAIPVVISDLPEMRHLVEEYQLGMVLEKRTPQSLAQTIRDVVENTDRYNSMVHNCKEARKELNWEAEEGKLLALYCS